MSQQNNRQLYWPPISSGQITWGWIFLIGGFTLLILAFYVFIPLGAILLWQGKKQQRLALEQRQHTLDATHSVLMSRVDYVGGHPLIPNAHTVVLGLSATHIIIYSIDSSYAIKPRTSISLKDVVQAGMGRPKSAREIYDEDYGRTIDVYEQSPFLGVVFKLKDDTYRVSFQSFESDTPPQKWYNQITALRYQLKSADNATSRAPN